MSICFIVGHGKSKNGGYDSGAVCKDYHEFRIAKEIARYAQIYYNSTYTEKCELMNYEGDKYLTERISAVNNAGYDFVAEFHLNAGGGTGTECYHHIGGAEGEKYAAKISAAISETLGIKNRGAKTKTGSEGRDYFAIIRETKPTAVLIETAFIDTADVRYISAISDGVYPTFSELNDRTNSSELTVSEEEMFEQVENNLFYEKVMKYIEKYSQEDQKIFKIVVIDGKTKEEASKAVGKTRQSTGRKINLMIDNINKHFAK